jgi:hypothetical protein
MVKILVALGLGAALVMAPVVAFADDAAPAGAAPAMAPATKPMAHHHHHYHHMIHHHHVIHHHPMMKKPMMKPTTAPADAPKS